MSRLCNLVLIIILGSTLQVAAEQRTYRCYTVVVPPKIDGILDDAAWQSLPTSNSFRELFGGNYADKQTYIKIGWDKDNLYIAVHCDEPDMKLISACMGDGAPLWTEDSIEIFLQPEHSASYFQFAVNSLGAKVGAERASGRTDFEAKGVHGPDYYTVEVKLPFALFGKTPQPGEAWRGNIDRNVWAGGKIYSCWSPLQGSFHDVANFGRFIFDPTQGTPELASAVQKSDTSDAKYRSELTARLKDVVKKCREYESVLESGLGLTAYRAEAEDLQKRLTEIKSLQETIATASLKELAKGARNGQDFYKKLYDFKYRVLLTKLLEEPESGQKQ